MVLYELREIKHHHFTDTSPTLSPTRHRRMIAMCRLISTTLSADTIGRCSAECRLTVVWRSDTIGRCSSNCRLTVAVDSRPWMIRGLHCSARRQSETGWFLDKLNCILFHYEEFIRLLKSKMCIEATGRRRQKRRLTTYIDFQTGSVDKTVSTSVKQNSSQRPFVQSSPSRHREVH